MLTQAVVLSMKQFVTVHGAIDTPRLANLHTRTADDVKDELVSAMSQSLNEVQKVFTSEALVAKFEDERKRLAKSLEGDAWKLIFPGKVVFARYCSLIGQEAGQIRQAYLKTAINDKPEVFSDVKRILESFRSLSDSSYRDH